MIERIPPSDIEAEAAVVAACFCGAQVIAEIQSTGLVPSDCYNEAHGEVLGACYNLTKARKPVDLITVRTQLAGNGIIEDAGGYGFLIELATSIPTAAHAAYYAKIVIEKSQRRQAIRALSNGLDSLFDPQSADPVGRIQAKVMALGGHTGTNKTAEFDDVVGRTFEALNDAWSNDNEPEIQPAFKTGIPGLDDLVWIEPGDFVIIGARPGDGKTSLGLQMMLNAARSGKRVLFHSLEMERKKIAMRYLSSLSGVSINRMKSGRLTLEEKGKVAHATNEAQGLPFRIEDTPNISVAGIAANLRRELLKGPVDALFVDHLLKVRPADGRADRRHQMSQISNDLDLLGQETGVAIVGLYQLKRAEPGKMKPPRLDDLKESGTIEEDADIVILIYQPDPAGSFRAADLIAAKNRDGAKGTIQTTFESQRMLFTEAKKVGTF